MPEIKEKPSKYWAERQLADVAKNDAEALAAYKDMEKFYNALEKELSNEVAYFYQQYGTDNVLEFAALRAKASPADVKLMYENWEAFAIKYPDYARLKPVREAMYKLDRYELLMEKARYQISELGAKEMAIMRDSLKSTAARTYGNMGKALSGNVALLDDLQADKMISTKWVSGQNFSDRVWKNKDKLLGHLDYDLRNGIIRGDDYKTLVGHLKSVTGASKRDAERLIRTESSYIANRANMQNYIDNGLKWYEYLAVEDLRTSEGCKSLDGQILPLDKAIIGSNYPPLHPNCRSRALPVSDRKVKAIGVNNIQANQGMKISYKGKKNDYSVNRKVVNSQAFKQKFENISSRKKVDKRIYEEAKRILEQRDGSGFESLIAIDAKTGKKIVENMNMNIIGKVYFNEEQLKIFNKFPGEVILIHNHPNGARPSYADIKTLFNEPKVAISIIIGHNGKIHILSDANKSINIVNAFEEMYNDNVIRLQKKDLAVIKSLDALYKFKLFKYLVR